MYTNSQIIPQYTGSSEKGSVVNPEIAENYVLTAEELCKLMLGRKFTLGNGVEVNVTYDEWTTNLFYLVKKNCICAKMKEGLIAVNPSGRRKDETGSSDGSSGSGAGSDGDCNSTNDMLGYPPFAVY